MCGCVCVCVLCSHRSAVTLQASQTTIRKKRKEPLIYSPTMHLHRSRAAPDLGDGEGYSLQDLIQLNVIPRILWHTVQWIYMIHCTINYVNISVAALTEQKHHFQPAEQRIIWGQRKQIYCSVFPTFYLIFIANTIDLTSVKKTPGLNKRFKVIWSTFIVTDFSSAWVHAFFLFLFSLKTS